MSFYRSFYNNTITEEKISQNVTLSGWVYRRRDHGGVIFIDLRDRTGYCQIVFRKEISETAHQIADKLRSEYVIKVTGKVVEREQENINPNLVTGKVEVEVSEIVILSESETLPFSIDDKEENETNEEIRLRYRYLDIRRNDMQQNLIKRHTFLKEIRNGLDEKKFIEIETPILNKATPEGARDFIVPSRLNENCFYALPQSPQIFKQILMVGAMEKYYQIVKCFRDEDLRSDRQPEFTQIDIETSFLTEEEILTEIEEIIFPALKKTFPEKMENFSIAKMTYDEAMESYGCDRPDTRFEMKLINVEETVKNCQFQVFQNMLKDENSLIRCICVSDGKNLSRKDIDDLTKYVGKFGAKGLAWMRVTDNGLESNIVKFFNEEIQKGLLEKTNAKNGDLLFFVADKKKIVFQALANLRLKIAEMLNMIDQQKMNFIWIVDFPLLEYDETEKRLSAVHHPFTMPKEVEVLQEIENLPLPEKIKKLSSLKSLAYDLVLNGVELGGGSVRIHDAKIQKQIFNLLGISKEQAEEKFGFLLKALFYGTPPHGGIAFGVDRIIMLMQNLSSIRDTIAFPKTQKGICLMSESPSPIQDEDLEELHIKNIFKD